MAPRATALDAGARGHPLGEVRGVSFRNLARRFSNQEQYRSLHWVGSFEDYLNIVHERPEVTRNAFQRVYDMVMSWGSDETTRYKRALTR
jgi:serine protein kinase